MEPIKDKNAKRQCGCGCGKKYPISDFNYIESQERYDSYTRLHRAKRNKLNYDKRRARIAAKLKSKAKAAPAKKPAPAAKTVAPVKKVKKDKPSAIQF
jgi:hypothetical protein